MEIIVSVFSAIVAMSCLFAVIKSDLQDHRQTAKNSIDAATTY
jgi:hypothetical protein